jgi:transcriptional regulator GlxA family with amidase domain
MIETTSRSLADIAAECGFCDAAHLIRLFRSELGVTPGALRRQRGGD